MNAIRESTTADIRADMLSVIADWIEERDGFGHPLLRQMAEEMRREQWQPIETAPQDNVAKLVWCPERQNIYEAVWKIAIYEDQPNGWGHFGSNDWLRETPTHWRPLPSPP